MLGKTKGIVLHSIPYNDKYAIIYMYTELYGRVSYMVSRSRSKKSAVSKALFMPLSVLELEVDHKPHQDIHRIKESKSCFPLNDLFCNPVKNLLTLFLAEVLYRILRETESDTKLFNYISDSIQLLEIADEGIANFHLVFLIHMLHFLGIYPNAQSYHENSYFDMLNGVFSDVQPLHRHYLDKKESNVFMRLLKINYENMRLFQFSRQERVSILSKILEYYRLHLPNFPEIKSLSILQSLYD